MNRPVFRSIREAWESYKTHCMPMDASWRQVHECKKTFYAASAAMHDMMLSLADLQEGDPAIDRVIETLQGELGGFVLELKAETAEFLRNEREKMN